MFSGCVCGQQKHLAVGDTIPSFVLQDQDGKDFDIKDQIGKHFLVIYFYPKDETPVCTKEACAFRDSYAEFTKAGALVIGISDGTVESHKAFQQHHQLPFVLLSDPGNRVLKLFGIKGWFAGRETLVVDKQGKILYRYNAFMKGSAHAENSLDAIKEKLN
jgi:peroxiredoxin Q/BCP